MPKISVLMGIYNCAGTLREAVDCIRNQTVSDWELILCDDGSSDNTYQIARELAAEDNRIVLLKNEKNLGLNKTLNRCLAAATGEFVARMDGDDLCSPVRFEKELALFDQHPDAALVSCSMDCFDESGTFGRVLYQDAPQPEDFLSGSQFCHAASMMRRSVLEELGGYSTAKHTMRVEDYDLWVRMYAAGYRGYNLPDILYSMRDDRNAIRRRKFRYRLNEAGVVLRLGAAFSFGLKTYFWAAIPVLKGCCPTFLYKLLHQRHLSR